ncbi:MAG: TatD family hydrolase [Hydrogenophaga sp.]|jgi:TatD DNase family protein|uniref:TatD family hydrolase n=1 Tax=Hydrogenophaga sp. TaxID=1904254 RepID=UPI001D6CB98C|nr:TatD family hydrolase [Hydrogenophaga sp.]MBW0170029.1 TatD family hydrolase [Hydrogenophaga sp.]MBW0185359.1 TatD family hydrolase [Hydrogenophaga sp.]
MWIDTHCHLDAPEFGVDHALALSLRARAAAQGVGLCVIPAVERANFDTVRTLAHRMGDAYALGIHPLYVPRAQDSDLAALDAALTEHRDDPRLVAVGEIGLDFFVPELCTPTMRERQVQMYRAQLRLARKYGLPVILHVRRSADVLLKHLRELPVAGIAHAFNGSEQQAGAFLDLGFKLGFGGACTFEPAKQLRRLAAELPLSALVLETDAPDIPPQWLYVTAAERALGRAQGINSPLELPRIGAVVAQLRGLPLEALREATTANARHALPRLAALEAVR